VRPGNARDGRPDGAGSSPRSSSSESYASSPLSAARSAIALRGAPSRSAVAPMLGGPGGRRGDGGTSGESMDSASDSPPDGVRGCCWSFCQRALCADGARARTRGERATVSSDSFCETSCGVGGAAAGILGDIASVGVGVGVGVGDGV
jgi:hypothetical protein